MVFQDSLDKCYTILIVVCKCHLIGGYHICPTIYVFIHICNEYSVWKCLYRVRADVSCIVTVVFYQEHKTFLFIVFLDFL